MSYETSPLSHLCISEDITYILEKHSNCFTRLMVIYLLELAANPWQNKDLTENARSLSLKRFIQINGRRNS